MGLVGVVIAVEQQRRGEPVELPEVRGERVGA